MSFIAAEYVVKQIVPHYEKAHIPHISEIKMAQKLISLHGEYRQCMKVPKVKREGNFKIADFKKKLGTPMPFFPYKLVVFLRL